MKGEFKAIHIFQTNKNSASNIIETKFNLVK